MTKAVLALNAGSSSIKFAVYRAGDDGNGLSLICKGIRDRRATDGQFRIIDAKGKTIAELGNRNKPLDMISYKKEGKDYLLMANSSRGVMKISTENIDPMPVNCIGASCLRHSAFSRSRRASPRAFSARAASGVYTSVSPARPADMVRTLLLKVPA